MSIKAKLFLVRGGARPSRFNNKNISEAEYIMEKKAVKPKKVKSTKPKKVKVVEPIKKPTETVVSPPETAVNPPKR